MSFSASIDAHPPRLDLGPCYLLRVCGFRVFVGDLGDSARRRTQGLIELCRLGRWDYLKSLFVMCKYWTVDSACSSFTYFDFCSNQSLSYYSHANTFALINVWCWRSFHNSYILGYLWAEKSPNFCLFWDFSCFFHLIICVKLPRYGDYILHCVFQSQKLLCP